MVAFLNTFYTLQNSTPTMNLVLNFNFFSNETANELNSFYPKALPFLDQSGRHTPPSKWQGRSG